MHYNLPTMRKCHKKLSWDVDERSKGTICQTKANQLAIFNSVCVSGVHRLCYISSISKVCISLLRFNENLKAWKISAPAQHFLRQFGRSVPILDQVQNQCQSSRGSTSGDGITINFWTPWVKKCMRGV